MISISNAKQNPTRMNMSVVLRAALPAWVASLRGPARFTIPTNNAPMAHTKVPTIIYANQWLNMPTKLGVLWGFVNS
jgi:hypothetical protein